MEIIREFIRLVTANQDQPLDLSVKRMPISDNSAQLENLNNNAENLMPCPENMAFELMNSVIVPSSATPTFQQPMLNNSWQRMKSMLLMPHQLEDRQQIFNALIGENSIEENITPKITKTKRPRSSIDKSVQPSKRTKLENEALQSKCPQVDGDDGVSDRVVIGSFGTSISRRDWNSINWNQSLPAITRKILVAVFDRHTLAHNTLSGKPSPAFIDCNKPEKGKLNPNMVADIVSFMTTHFPMKARDVKCVITSKCADEAKSLRQRLSVGK